MAGNNQYAIEVGFPLARIKEGVSDNIIDGTEDSIDNELLKYENANLLRENVQMGRDERNEIIGEDPALRAMKAEEAVKEASSTISQLPTTISDTPHMPMTSFIEKDDWYSGVEGWFKAVDDHIAEAEGTGISQGGSRAVAGIGKAFILEPLKALRKLQDADLSQPPSTTPDGDRTASAVAELAVNTGILSTVAPAPAGALRLFGGRVAAENLGEQGIEAANQAMTVAQMMKKRGATEDQIRKATNHYMEEADLGGISIGADDKLRLEFSDKYSAVQHWDAMKSGEIYNLGMVFKHDTLYKLYPDMGIDVTVSINKVTDGARNYKPSASYQPDTRHIKVNAKNEEDARSAILHELQHELQRMERFAPGGNTDMVRGTEAEAAIRARLDEAKKIVYNKRGKSTLWTKEEVDLLNKYGPDPAHATYKRIGGEVEARTVQRRAEMTAKEQRALAPRHSEDIPRNEQLSEGDLQLGNVPEGLRYIQTMEVPRSLKTPGERRVRLREIENSMTRNTRDLERLKEHVTSGRFTPAVVESKQRMIERIEAQLIKHSEEKLALSNVSTTRVRRDDMGFKVVNQTAPASIGIPVQGVPKKLSEDIGRAPKRRSKLERLREREESLTSIIENEVRFKRVERAKKELDKVKKELEKVLP
jgi:hypothetical protein